MGLASVLYPQAIQRIFAAKSGRALKRSFSGMTFMPLVTTLVVTLIGVAAIARFDIANAVDTDEVVPMLLRDRGSAGGFSTSAALLIFLGALSADHVDRRLVPALIGVVAVSRSARTRGSG